VRTFLTKGPKLAGVRLLFCCWLFRCQPVVWPAERILCV